MIGLVTDGDTRAALAITRSLGRRGVFVLVGDAQRRSLASSSRYCARHVTYPSPFRDPKAFERFLLDFLQRERVDAVIPVTDVTTRCVAANRRALSAHCAIAVPRLEAFELVTDKGRLLRYASSCDVPIPETHFVNGVADLDAIADRLAYPVVVKPTRSKIYTDDGWLETSVQYAGSASELWSRYRTIGYLAHGPSLIQERITGPGIGFFGLFDRGRLVAAFAHRRLREKPPSGGVSVLRESIPISRTLADHALRLLGPLEWHGVAMLEFKEDRRDGRPRLIEVNGRYWGSLQLAVDAGVDFPWLCVEVALGYPVGPPPSYRAGVKSRWLLGDLDHLLSRFFKSHAAQHLPDAMPSRLRTFVDFLKVAQRDMHYEIERREDPGPAFYEARRYIAALCASTAHRVHELVGIAASPAERAAPRVPVGANGGSHAGARR